MAVDRGYGYEFSVMMGDEGLYRLMVNMVTGDRNDWFAVVQEIAEWLGFKNHHAFEHTAAGDYLAALRSEEGQIFERATY